MTTRILKEDLQKLGEHEYKIPEDLMRYELYSKSTGTVFCRNAKKMNPKLQTRVCPSNV